jgi:hypothetical protein
MKPANHRHDIKRQNKKFKSTRKKQKKKPTKNSTKMYTKQLHVCRAGRMIENITGLPSKSLAGFEPTAVSGLQSKTLIAWPRKPLHLVKLQYVTLIS